MTTRLLTNVKSIHTITEDKNSLQAQVFKLLLKYNTGLNIRQIARKLKIDKSSASARLNELRNFEHISFKNVDYNVVALYQSRDGVTNKTVKYWGVRSNKAKRRA